MNGAAAALIALDSVDDTPALVVDLGGVEANIHRMAGYARMRSVALRPHTKTHKLPQLARLQGEMGANGIAVAKLGEAQVMAAGIRDILIAYPIVGPAKVSHLQRLAEIADVTAVVDGMEAAELLDRSFRRAGRRLNVLLEVDTGMGRCGVLPGASAIRLAKQLARLPGLRFAGLMTHEGHPYRGRGAHHTAAVGRAAAQAMVDTAEQIRAAGVSVDTVSLGCSLTARAVAEVDGVTEVRPGTYVYNDRSQLLHGACIQPECAARVVATVVSRSAQDRAVVDAGSKTLALDPTLCDPPEPGFGLITNAAGWLLDRMSEEHGVLTANGDATALAVGDRLEIIPNHICSVVNLQDRVYVARNGRVIDEWPVLARGKIQ